MSVPTYLPYYIFAGGIAIIASALVGLRQALAAANWTERGRTPTVRAAAVLLIGWFALAVTLGALGAYQASADRFPTIQYGILVPILIGVVLLWRSPTVRRILDAVPLPWLIGVQLYRALGVMFLILHAGGMLPDARDAEPSRYCRSDPVSAVATGCGLEMMKAATSHACCTVRTGS
jgi:hypothetical protein